MTIDIDNYAMGYDVGAYLGLDNQHHLKNIF